MDIAVDPEDSRAYELARMRHSAAHLMAEAVQEMFPDAKFGIGPAIDNGFYYDFELPRSLTPDDLQQIEKRMRTAPKQERKSSSARRSPAKKHSKRSATTPTRSS